MRVKTIEEFKEVATTAAEAIREAGEMPSGHLYAILMDQLSLPLYNEMIATLKRAKLVEERGHVLKYIGTI